MLAPTNHTFQVDGVIQHLQGVLGHGSGRGIKIYRTFDNIKNGANLAIYCLLASLEAQMLKEGGLPDTLFLQVQHRLYICTYTLFERVFDNRLMAEARTATRPCWLSANY